MKFYSNISEFNQNKMLKNILKISLLGFFLISCTETDEQIENLVSTDNPIVNNPDIEKLNLKFSVDKNEGNIFDPFNFKLEQDNQSFYLGNLSPYLDSLVLKVSDIKETKKLFERHENGISGTTKFLHHFSLPGIYNADILGYKNGKITYKDGLKVSINNDKDFLTTNWNNFTTTPHSVGYFDILTQSYLAFYNGFEDSNPFILIHVSRNNYNDYTADQIKQLDRDFLYNYFVKFYSTPQFTEDNTSNLKDIYAQNFKKSLKNDIPVSIWITNKNKIALMKEYSATNSSQFYGYRIIAEPNN